MIRLIDKGRCGRGQEQERSITMEENMSVDFIADEVIIIDKDEYDMLRRKANVVDILAEDIRMKIDEGAGDYSLVDHELVLILTGMKAYLRDKRQEEAKRNAAMLKESTGKDEADE
ncbi:MAG: hypothetical protein IKP40_13585 [Clostridia bacterium]|nr:hypothetical protein [Clostridia bacterium]